MKTGIEKEYRDVYILVVKTCSKILGTCSS